MSEPTTEAGRALLRSLAELAEHQAAGVPYIKPPARLVSSGQIAIENIEAEARDELRRSLAARVALELDDFMRPMGTEHPVYLSGKTAGLKLARAAVLAIIEGKEPGVSAPVRIQRRRDKGWRMPPNTVYVGRPSRWGNPFVVGPGIPTADQAVAAFRLLVEQSPNRQFAAKALRGKNLACWCSLDQPCHADVLLELANR